MLAHGNKYLPYADTLKLASFRKTSKLIVIKSIKIVHSIQPHHRTHFSLRFPPRSLSIFIFLFQSRSLIHRKWLVLVTRRVKCNKNETYGDNVQ